MCCHKTGWWIETFKVYNNIIVHILSIDVAVVLPYLYFGHWRWWSRTETLTKQTSLICKNYFCEVSMVKPLHKCHIGAHFFFVCQHAGALCGEVVTKLHSNIILYQLKTSIFTFIVIYNHHTPHCHIQSPHFYE